MTTDLEPGHVLNPCSSTISAGMVAAYALVAKDPNPIHFFDEAARALGFPGAIAHGMISGAMMSKMLTSNIGAPWVERGHLRLRFVAPVLVGETVTASGTVTGTGPLVIDVRATRADGTAVIVGTATVRSH